MDHGGNKEEITIQEIIIMIIIIRKKKANALEINNIFLTHLSVKQERLTKMAKMFQLTTHTEKASHMERTSRPQTLIALHKYTKENSLPFLGSDVQVDLNSEKMKS